MVHHATMELEERLPSVDRCPFGGQNVAAVDALVDPHHRVADHPWAAGGEAPVGAVRSATDVWGETGVQVDRAVPTRPVGMSDELASQEVCA